MWWWWWCTRKGKFRRFALHSSLNCENRTLFHQLFVLLRGFGIPYRLRRWVFLFWGGCFITGEVNGMEGKMQIEWRTVGGLVVLDEAEVRQEEVLLRWLRLCWFWCPWVRCYGRGCKGGMSIRCRPANCAEILDVFESIGKILAGFETWIYQMISSNWKKHSYILDIEVCCTSNKS